MRDRNDNASVSTPSSSPLTRLDHNRAVSQIAQKLDARQRRQAHDDLGQSLGHAVSDLFNCKVSGATLRHKSTISRGSKTRYPTVAKRGAAIIEARGASSAASAASAATDHMRSWALGTDEGDWVSMGVASDGSYGVPKGLISSFPCQCSGGKWKIVKGLPINEFSRKRIDASVAELEEERQAVRDLGLI